MKNFLKLFFISVLILFVSASCSKRLDYLPGTVDNFKLTKKLTGKQALDFVNRLHFENVTDEENMIGFYSYENNNAMIYVTVYDTDNEAEINYQRMTEKISPHNSVFTKGKYLTLDGNIVYRCFGMGQTHFVFFKNNVLVWLSADSNLANKLVEDYLEYIT